MPEAPFSLTSSYRLSFLCGLDSQNDIDKAFAKLTLALKWEVKPQPLTLQKKRGKWDVKPQTLTVQKHWPEANSYYS